jgi:hypothetical protein
VRRRAFLGLVLAAPTVAAVGLPTLTPAWGGARPVPPSITRVRLGGVERAAAGRQQLSSRTLALTSQRETAAFSLLGVTWLPDPGVDVDVRVRTRSAGRWTDWVPVPLQGDHRPDGVETPELREGTVPRWVGPSDAVQVRVDHRGGPRPRDLRLELVDPGSSPADRARAPWGSAFAEESRPVIITRAQWGADESIRRGSPSYNSTVKVGFVHHTASSNDYTREQAAAMVRGIYAYHVKSNGWSDIGYNYLVDRFGRAYEGRYGGLDRFVVGAHTGGFNRDSFAVSLLGDFRTVPPSAETLATLSDVLAWKLGSAYRDPLGTATLTSAGGGTSRYSAGSKVEFEVVSGHRDAGNTTCPGDTVYSQLPAVRSQVAEKLGAGFADPVLTGGAMHARGSRGPVTLTAHSLGPLEWTATVGDSAGNLLRTATGAAVMRGDEVSLTWDLTDAAGEPVRPGTYVLRLTGSGVGDRALPYATQVVVKAEACRGAPLQRAKCKAKRR